MSIAWWVRGLFSESDPYFECRECGQTARPGAVRCSNCGREEIAEYDVR